MIEKWQVSNAELKSGQETLKKSCDHPNNKAAQQTSCEGINTIGIS